MGSQVLSLLYKGFLTNNQEITLPGVHRLSELKNFECERTLVGLPVYKDGGAPIPPPCPFERRTKEASAPMPNCLG